VTAADPARRRPSRAELLSLQGLYVLYLPVWAWLSIGSALTIPAWESPLAVPLLLLVFAYPVVLVVAAVAAWVLHRSGRRRASRTANLLPLPWLAAGAALLVWVLAAG